MSMIYALRCPVANTIRYIGKSKNPYLRFASHLNLAKGKKVKNHCARWIRKLLALGLEPSLEIVYRIPDGEDWRDAETRFIAQYKAAGYPLTNSTSGGDGWHDMPPEILEKRVAAQAITMREIWKDPVIRERYIEARRPAFASPELRAKFSAISKATAARPGQRAIASAASAAAWGRKKASMTPADMARLSKQRSEQIKAAWADPEAKARHVAAMNAPDVKARRYATRDTPEGLLMRGAKLKAAWADPERRAKRIAAGRAPEAIAKRVAASQATWARRKAAQQLTEAA